MRCDPEQTQHYKQCQKMGGSNKLPLLFFLAARFTGCDLAAFWKRRSHLTDLVADMIPPDFSYIRKILLPLFYTIQMSVTGTVLGAFFAIAAAPFAAANLKFPAAPRRVLRILIQVLRSFPALILALTATFLFGLGTFAGTFAITLYTFAIMTKLTYEDISAADPKPYLALCSMGVSRFQAYVHAVIPDIALDFSPMHFISLRPMCATAPSLDMWVPVESVCCLMRKSPGWNSTRLA